jgi:hypothetical protein
MSDAELDVAGPCTLLSWRTTSVVCLACAGRAPIGPRDCVALSLLRRPILSVI